MPDFDAIFAAHTCAGGGCRRDTHRESIALAPQDVSPATAEIATLVAARDALARHGYRLREGPPMPRFEPGETGPKPWEVVFERRPALPSQSRTTKNQSRRTKMWAGWTWGSRRT